MTVTPIFDDLAAYYAASAPSVAIPSETTTGPPPAAVRRPAPRPRTATVVGFAAFGRGCLEGTPGEPDTDDDELTRLLDGARREAVALGRCWVDTVHLALAAVRAGGDVGRVFGMRGVGPAVLLAALDDDGDDDPGELTGGDPVRPAVSSVARTVLHRVAHRAAREGRAVTAAEVAVAVARSGRVADLLGRLGVDLDDLADALTAGGSAAVPVGPVEPAVDIRPPVPVGVVAPVRVMLPATAVASRDPAARAVDGRATDDRAVVVPA